MKTSLPVCLLVVFGLSGINGNINITLPINLTSWRISLQDLYKNTFNRSVTPSLRTRLTTSLNNTLGFLRNGSVGCTPEGEECIPEVPSCCPSTSPGHLGDVDDNDLICLLQGNVHRCVLIKEREDEKEIWAQERLNALEYGSAGELGSHPWANSWEFQSRSEAEREELQAMQDAEWKKNWKPSSKENFWLKSYKKVKNEAVNIWKDLKKMKKLKEVKDSLIEKKNRRLEVTVSPVKHDIPVTQNAVQVLYPDEPPETGNVQDQTKTESEESVIKFSDELPKPTKKFDFRLDDIINDAVNLVSKKSKKKTNQGSHPIDKKGSAIPSFVSEEELLRLDEIQGTVDQLMSEINELKKLKLQKEENVANKEKGLLNLEDKVTDEQIRKQVRNILEEKRRLLQLRKLEEDAQGSKARTFKT